MSDPVVILLCTCLLGNMHGWHHKAQKCFGLCREEETGMRTVSFENQIRLRDFSPAVLVFFLFAFTTVGPVIPFFSLVSLIFLFLEKRDFSKEKSS